MKNLFTLLNKPINFLLLFCLFFIFNCGSTPKQIDPVEEPLPAEEPSIEVVAEEKEELEEPDDNTIYFNFNEYKISEEGIALLDLHIEYLENVANTSIVLEGNTDSVGSNEANYKLGMNRALAVFDYLTKNGIPENRIEYRSLSEKNLLYPKENNQEEQAKNRRVEIYYTYN